MRRLEIADVEVMRLAVQQEITRSEGSRYDHRLHGVLLISRGPSCYQVADWLGENPRTIERWVHRFESRGFAGLQEGERAGRPPQLRETQLAAVGRDLRRFPRDWGLWPKPLGREAPVAPLGEGLTRGSEASSMSAVDPSVCASACANPARLSPTPTQRRRADIKKLHRQARDPKVDLWSLDECLFQQHGTRSLMWVPPEQTNPVLLHAPTRKSVALFGAVNLRQGQLVTQPEPKFDGLSFGRFLRHICYHTALGVVAWS
jgi:hypothetical protein